MKGCGGVGVSHFLDRIMSANFAPFLVNCAFLCSSGIVSRINS